MFSHTTFSNPIQLIDSGSSTSSSHSVDHTRGLFTPSVLSGILSGLQRQLNTLQQHERKSEQLNADYFEKLLPTLYPITQQGSGAALESTLHDALSQRQHLMKQINVVRTNLVEQGLQLKSTRQQIHDVNIRLKLYYAQSIACQGGDETLSAA